MTIESLEKSVKKLSNSIDELEKNIKKSERSSKQLDKEIKKLRNVMIRKGMIIE